MPKKCTGTCVHLGKGRPMGFVLYADKTQLLVRQQEPITSGSMNVYPVRFEFSEEWEGMDKTASFRFHGRTVSVVLDKNGECQIPWDIIDHYEPWQKLYVGVCGMKGGTVVLPTAWASLGEILPGVTFGQNARPPTPNLWEQKLAQKQDKLTGRPGQVAGFDENGNLAALDIPAGEGGTSDHQHPIEAITGLAELLRQVPRPMTAAELQNILNGGKENE